MGEVGEVEVLKVLKAETELPESELNAIDLNENVADLNKSTGSSDYAIPIVPYVEYVLPSLDKEYYYKTPHGIRCLGEIELSRSSLLRNPYFIYSEQQDPGVTEDLWKPADEVIYDDIGVKRYKDLCKKYQTAFVRKFATFLDTEKVNLKYYGLSTKAVRAVTETIQYNKYITFCDLTDNWLIPSASGYVGDMLAGNHILETLILKECRIGVEGARSLSVGLAKNTSLKGLDLSYNSIQDQGIKFIAEALPELPKLAVLNISHNELNSKAGEVLGPALQCCRSLERLDVSWNNIKDLPGTKVFFEGIRENYQQKCTHLNMAWNNLRGMPAAGPLAAFMKKHSNFQFLDVSNNLFQGDSLKLLLTGVTGCKTFVELRIGLNPLPEEDIETLLSTLQTSLKKNAFKILDLTDMYLDKRFNEQLKAIAKKGRTVRFRGLTSNWVIGEPDYAQILLERCKFIVDEGGGKKKKKAPKKKAKEFGTWFYELPSDAPMTKSDFVAKFIAPINCKQLSKDDALIKELMKTFEDEKKKVMVAEMRDKFLSMYPDTEKPPPPKKPPSIILVPEEEPAAK